MAEIDPVSAAPAQPEERTPLRANSQQLTDLVARSVQRGLETRRLVEQSPEAAALGITDVDAFRKEVEAIASGKQQPSPRNSGVQMQVIVMVQFHPRQ